MAINKITRPVSLPQTEGARKILSAQHTGNFRKTLDQTLGETSNLPPSSPEAKQRLEVIRQISQMELVNLNTTLMRALSGGGGGGGGGMMPGQDGLLSLLPLLQTLQLHDESPAGSQNADGADGETDAGRHPVRGGVAAIDSDPDTVIPARLPSMKDDPETFNFEIDFDKVKAKAEKRLGPGKVNSIIEKVASAIGIDPNLVRAVVKTESNFNPQAVSHAGAMGLMQLMPETAEGLGVTDPFDPISNVMGGSRYLKQMLDRYDGNIDKALAAYNWGPGNLERNMGKGWMPQETRNYIRIVNQHYQAFSSESEEA